MTQQHSTPTSFVIDPATRLGAVHYTTADLDRQVAFYQDSLGFKLHWRDDSSAGLGAGGQDLLRLTQQDGAQRVRGTTGLYHTAFLVPTRWELAQLVRRIAETRTPIEGTNDHGTHLAIYLPDAEGNGIELAWDRPREMWPTSFEQMMNDHRGLDPYELLLEVQNDPTDWQGIDPDTVVGHVHLHVADLRATEHFYREILGFEIPGYLKNPPPQFANSARFFSAGGYHHHIGTNVWQGVGAPPPPPDATGLRYFTVLTPDPTPVIERVQQAGIPLTQTQDGWLLHDPAQNGVLITNAS